jgi:hypothetical protein
MVISKTYHTFILQISAKQRAPHSSYKLRTPLTETEHTVISKTYHTFIFQISAKQRASHSSYELKTPLTDILYFIPTLTHDATTMRQLICACWDLTDTDVSSDLRP